MGLLGTARRFGLMRGLLGGSRPWLVLGGVAWTFRALQWARRPGPTTLLREELGVGETISIRLDPPEPTRRQRRKAERRRRRAR